MEQSGRFDVRVAGGFAAVTNASMVVAGATALDLARKGYRVWIREKTTQSWAAETIVVKYEGTSLLVRTIDAAPPRYLSKFQALLAELEAA